jgi:diguanylate cyclase (GGDEF)-like protein
MLGFESREELLALGRLDYVNRSDFVSVSSALRDLGTLSNVEIAIRKKDGSVAWVLQNLKIVVVEEASKAWVDVAMFDVTEQRVAQQRFEYQAYHDTLTLLPNRMLFVDRMQVALAQARRRHASSAVMVLDIDAFDHVNESFGRGLGDRVLKALAERLTTCVREEDSIARLNGDEFIILLGQISSGTDASVAAQRVLDAVSRPFHIAGQRVEITGSLGVAVSPEDGTEVDPLVRAASTAAVDARGMGGNSFQFYEPTLNARALERASLVVGLRHALDRGELELHYQPEVNVQTGRIECIEALLRWRHPDLGLVTASEFLVAAEQGGLGRRIAEWAVNEACRQVRAWHDAGMPNMRVAVNLSKRQFQDPGVTRLVERAVGDNGISGRALEIEIPENSLVDSKNAAEVLNALKEIGILLAVDDFGSGGCSFLDLKSLPLDTLKIAPMFVQNMVHRTDDAAIVQAMITMAKGLDLRVVAEGVETKEQLSHLLNRRCVEMQGYFLGKPMPAPALADVLRMQH